MVDLSQHFYLENKRQMMIKPYDTKKNTKGREFISKQLIPRFAKRFKTGDRVLFVGKHWFWDYSPFFSNTIIQCDYKTLDIRKDKEPDILDDITNSKVESNSFDGVMYVGMDNIGIDNAKAIEHIHRILKPGGRLFISLSAGGDRPLGSNLLGNLEKVKAFVVDEICIVYGPEFTDVYTDGRPSAYFITCRKENG